MATQKSAYQILGIEAGTSHQEIKQAAQRRADEVKQALREKDAQALGANGSDAATLKQAAQQRMAEIKAAYTQLSRTKAKPAAAPDAGHAPPPAEKPAKPAPPPAAARKSWLRPALAALLLLILGAAGFYAQPYWIARQLQQAVRDGDADTALAHIDLPRLRENVTRRLQGALKTDSQEPGDQMANMMMGMMVRGITERLLTPEDLRRALQESDEGEMQGKAYYAFSEFPTFFIDVQKEQGGETRRLRLILKQQGLTWRVSDAYLPDAGALMAELKQAGAGAAQNQRRMALYQAATSNDLEQAKTLLAEGADPNQDFLGNLALHSSVEQGHRDMAELLLAHQADPERKDDEGYSALFYAGTPEMFRLLREHGAAMPADKADLLRRYAMYGSTDLVQAMLDAGAAVDAVGEHGGTALSGAVASLHPHVVELLLAAGADPNLADGEIHTPLAATTLTALGYNPENVQKAKNMMQLLLEHGADPDLANAYGRAPVHIAVEFDGSADGAEVMRILLEGGADPNLAVAAGRERYTPLALAVGEARSAVAEALLAHGVGPDGVFVSEEFSESEPSEKTPLYYLAGMRNFTPEREKILHALLQAGADPNYLHASGKTPLYRALENGHGALFEALIAAGAKTDLPGAQPLLQIAVEKGNPKTLKSLLDKGADVNIMLKNGDPLIYHIANRLPDADKDPALIEALLAAGVELDVHDEDGKAPLHRAIYWGNERFVDFFLHLGAEPLFQDKDGNTALHYALRKISSERRHGESVPDYPGKLLKPGMDVNIANHKGETPLAIALEESLYSEARLLLEHGAELGDAPVDKYFRNAAYFGEIEMMKILLQRGPDIDKPAKNGETVLHGSAARGRLEVVKFLLEHGAALDAVDKQGRTPLHAARTQAVAKYLIDQGADTTLKNKKGELPKFAYLKDGTANPAAEPNLLRNTPAALSAEAVVAMLKDNGFNHPADLSKYGLAPSLKGAFRANIEAYPNAPTLLEWSAELMWQTGGKASLGKVEQADLKAYVERKNGEGYGSYVDWRLPTLEELASLMKAGRQATDLYLPPAFDHAVADWYWSADKVAGDGGPCGPGAHWMVNFSLGAVGYGDCAQAKNTVMLVRQDVN